MDALHRFAGPEGREIATHHLAGASPTVVFLPGLRSDMQGSKALETLAFCQKRGQAMLRLDYSGHGASSGRFEDGTISQWAADALAVINATTQDKLILIGSSMGGWIALLLARSLGARVAGFIGIAAAPDFTEDLIWASLAPQDRARIESEGHIIVESAYAPLTITRAFIEDGRRHRVLTSPIPLSCPVRLLQGQQDAEVPWQTALTLAQTIEGPDVQVMLIKDGDHRLSRPQDIALLTRTLSSLLDALIQGEDRGQT
jgi:pimeloyl-ACP methyl ester carboxylesterase